MTRSRRVRAPDLDVPWRDVEYCVVDVETTGLDHRRDEMISFGSVLVRSGRLCVGTGTYLAIRPSRPISEKAMTVHGLRRQDLASGLSAADAADLIRAELDGRVLAAHAAWIEQRFLGRLVPGRRGRRSPVVDTAALLRATGLAPTGTGHEPDLETAAVSLGLCVHSPHHALGDALTTAEVLLATVSRLEHDNPSLTARALTEISHRHSRT